MPGYEDFTYSLFSKDDRRESAPLALPASKDPPRVHALAFHGGIAVFMQGAEAASIGTSQDALTEYSAEALAHGVRIRGACAESVFIAQDGQAPEETALTDAFAGLSLRIVCDICGVRVPAEYMPRALFEKYPLYLRVSGRAGHSVPAFSCYAGACPPHARDEKRLAARSERRQLHNGKLFIGLSAKACDNARYILVLTDDARVACASCLVRIGE